MSGIKVPNLRGSKQEKPIIVKPQVKYEIPDWLIVAFNFIGVSEIVGPQGSNPIIDEFLKYTGMPSDDDIAWCAASHGWILEEAGYQGTKKPNAQSYLNWGIELEGPKFGCTVIYKRGKEPWMGHVGFWLDEFQGWIRTLGGNQSNRYGISNYKKADVLGYRWPKDLYGIS